VAVRTAHAYQSIRPSAVGNRLFRAARCISLGAWPSFRPECVPPSNAVLMRCERAKGQRSPRLARRRRSARLVSDIGSRQGPLAPGMTAVVAAPVSCDVWPIVCVRRRIADRPVDYGAVRGRYSRRRGVSRACWAASSAGVTTIGRECSALTDGISCRSAARRPEEAALAGAGGRGGGGRALAAAGDAAIGCGHELAAQGCMRRVLRESTMPSQAVWVTLCRAPVSAGLAFTESPTGSASLGLGGNMIWPLLARVAANAS